LLIEYGQVTQDKDFPQDLVSAFRAFDHVERIRDLSEVQAVLFEKSDFHAIVLGMTYLDNVLGEIIARKLPTPDALDLKGMSYTQKVSLAYAVGVNADKVKPALGALGAMRNQYAHSVSFKLDADFNAGYYDRLTAAMHKSGYHKAVEDSLESFIASALFLYDLRLSTKSAYVRLCIMFAHAAFKSILDSILEAQGVKTSRPWRQGEATGDATRYTS
jgi:hypothetical protein